MSRALLLLLLCSCTAPAVRPPPGSLARAALDGDVVAVLRLLGQSADPNDRLGELDPPLNHVAYEKWTALTGACRNGHIDVVRALLSAGTDLTLDDGYGATALDVALGHGKHGEEIALLLIAAGAPVDTRVGVYIDDYGDGDTSALHRAVGRGSRPVVKAMLKRGAYVHLRTTGRWTPLFYAEDPEIIRMLVRAGAGLEAKDRDGMTPLAFALVRNRDDAAMAFLKAGANPNILWGGWHTPLHETIQPERKPLVQALLEAGANPNAKDDLGMTPLQYLARRSGQENEEMALLFLAKGGRADVGADRWEIPLHSAAMFGHHRLATALLDRGAAVNLRDSEGDTALHVACESGHEELVKLLLARGADVRVKNKEGSTPVDEAKTQAIRNLLTDK